MSLFSLVFEAPGAQYLVADAIRLKLGVNWAGGRGGFIFISTHPNRAQFQNQTNKHAAPTSSCYTPRRNFLTPRELPPMLHLPYHRALTRIREQIARLHERLDHMATKAQVDKLTVDVTALINAAVDDITRAIAFAQASSSDPAIDVLDTKVTAAIQTLQTAAAGIPDPSAGTPPAPATPTVPDASAPFTSPSSAPVDSSPKP